MLTILDRLEELGVPVIDTEFAATITPEVAAEMLRANTHNRKEIMAAIRQYTGAMQRGEWRLNGRTLVFSEDGVLLDGQHTLKAVVASGVTIQCFVVVIPDPEAQLTMDHGRSRRFQDALSMNPETRKYATETGATCRSIFAYEKNGVPSGTRLTDQPTDPQLFDVLDRHPGIREAVLWASRGENRPRFMVLSHVATHYYIFATYNDEDAASFFQHLVTGTGLHKGDAILTLRERLIKERNSPGKGLRTDNESAFVIKAFNAWRRGDPLHKLTLKLGGASPEQFPTIEILDKDNPHPLLPGKVRHTAIPRPRSWTYRQNGN